VILITAGSDYPVLNGTQCEVVFTPTEFAVSVDVTNKNISVVPVTTTAENASIVPFDPTIRLADNVIDQVNGIGGTSTTLYRSVVADALMSNIDAATNDTSTSPPETTFDAMADSFEAIIDELLLFVGSSQFFVPNNGTGDFSTVDALLTVQAVKFGEANYVFPTFVMCALLLVVAAVEAYRTRLWKSLPKWDFTDATCMVIASAVAGKDILAEICQDEEGMQVDWTGAGSGGWWSRKSRGQGSCRELEDVSGKVSLRLGRKMIRVDSTSKVRYSNRDQDHIGRDQVQLTAVSLWPSGASGVVALV
jgi:hypothetical protein